MRLQGCSESWRSCMQQGQASLVNFPDPLDVTHGDWMGSPREHERFNTRTFSTGELTRDESTTETLGPAHLDFDLITSTAFGFLPSYNTLLRWSSCPSWTLKPKMSPGEGLE